MGEVSIEIPTQIHILLVVKLLLMLYYPIRRYKEGVSMFLTVGPIQILNTLFVVCEMIAFKKSQALMAYVMINVVMMFAFLLYEKKYAQSVYYLTIVVNYSYFVQTLTIESLPFVESCTQYVQLLQQVYIIYILVHNKDSSAIDYISIGLLLIDAIIWMILMDVQVGSLKFGATLLIFRIYRELKQYSKVKKE